MSSVLDARGARKVAIDVGGTFTDCLVLDEKGELGEFKASTTPGDPSIGFMESVQKAAAAYGEDLNKFLGNCNVIIHGTTLATNALITGRIAKTAMITTKGFRDVVLLRRGFGKVDSSIYNLFLPPYKPPVPRYFRLGVSERTLYTGDVHTPVDEPEVRDALSKLHGSGVESIAVCYLHSYANPHNEKRTVEICKEAPDGVYVAASHEILPVWREYERFSTTMVSACVGPIVEQYLKALQARLREAGFSGTLLMMLASGMVQSAEHCIPRAVYLMGSGPAAGPSAALQIGHNTERQNFLSVDVGGTSFDVCLVHEGKIPSSSEGWVGEERVAIKSVDVRSIGAGGGSIAWVDRFGLLRVGPLSAGAEPGPAAYGKGGTEPTVTDSAIILGYIPTDFFLGGEMQLNPVLSQQAVARLGDKIGKDVPGTAQAIFDTVNSFMADYITEIATKRGYDVRDYTIVAGGGGGPLHSAFIADLLGIDTVIIPSAAALYSAFGMFAMDMGRDYARSYISRADVLDFERVNRLYEEMEQDAAKDFAGLHVPRQAIVFNRTADMRYVGQFHEVETDVPVGRLGAKDLDTIIGNFHQKHKELFTFDFRGRALEILTFRLQASVPRGELHVRQVKEGSTEASGALKRTRRCLFHGKPIETPVYDGDRLLAGNVFSGPAIVEEKKTTVVIPPGFVASVGPRRDYFLRRQ